MGPGFPDECGAPFGVERGLGGYWAIMDDDQATDGFDEKSDDTTEEPTDGGKLDEYDDAVLAADDTGMLAGERQITLAAIEEGTSGG
jgi:hypothetical protein